FVRDGNRAALPAVDDRDRAAPVALPAHAPVSEPVRDGGRALSSIAQLLDDPALCLLEVQPVELVRVDHATLLVDHLDDRQVERLGELTVTLVVSRNAHD